MIKSLVLALAVGAAALGAAGAQARGVSWSIGINAPFVGAVVSAPAYYAPAPVYMPVPVYAQAPVYSEPVYSEPVYSEPVYSKPVYAAAAYAPVPVYGGYYPGRVHYRPAPVFYPRYAPGFHRGYGHWDGRARR
jgi:hypothetical protein